MTTKEKGRPYAGSGPIPNDVLPDSSEHTSQHIKLQAYSLAHRYSINAATAEVLAPFVFALGGVAMKSTKQQKQQQKRELVRVRKQKFALLKRIRSEAALSSSAKMAMWSLLEDFHNTRTGQCNPSFTAIAKAIGRARRSTIVAISELKDAGWVIVETTNGGSYRNTNRFKFDWDKTSTSANPDKPSAKADNPIDDVEETVEAAETGQAESADFEDGHFTEIIEENEDNGCGTPHRCREIHEGCRTPHTNPLRTPPSSKEEEEGGEASAACGFAAPLKKEEEEEFGQLCEAWQVREQWHPSVDMAKAREAFAALEANHGDEIRAQGVSVGYYLLARAQVWIAEINSPEFLPKLEAWLGMAPGFKGEVVQWWQKRPRQMGGGRNTKPDFLNLGLGRRAS